MATALVVTAAPLILLLPNRDWLFTHEGWLDPWHYVGFFREYWNPDFAPGAYKLARLPWILSGMVFTKLLPVAAAAYALHLTFFCATVLAMFVGMRWLFQRTTLAAIVALCFGFYTHAHGSGGWDYHNTGAAAFYVGTFMVLASKAAVSGHPAALAIAGALAALAVHTNITFVNFLPVLGFVHLRTAQGRGITLTTRNAGHRLIVMALGAVGVTIALGAVNLLAGREFLFFKVLFDIVVRYVSNPENQAKYRPAAGWFYTAAHLALPAAMFVVGSLALVWRRGPLTSDERLARVLIGQFLVMSIVWIGWHFAGQTALDWSYFAFALVPSCFIAFGGLLRLGWPDGCERFPILVSVTAALILSASIGGLAEPWLQSMLTPAVMSSVALVSGAVYVSGFVAWLLRPTAATLAVLLSFYAGANRIGAANVLSDYVSGDPCKTQREVYLAIVDAATWIGSVDPSYARVRVWYPENDTMDIGSGCRTGVGLMGGSIANMAFVQYVVNPFPMPDVRDIPDEDVAALSAGEYLLTIITESQRNVEAWSTRLAQMGLLHREVGRHEVRIRNASFRLHAWVVQQPAPKDTVFTDPLITVTDRTRPEVNTYGFRKGEIAEEDRHVVFRPTDERDHLAYAMTDVTTISDRLWARLEVEGDVANAVSCRVAVQDRNLDTLVTAPCQTATKYFVLPTQVTGLRVVTADGRGRPFTLPRRVTVTTAAEEQ